jgi:hypothetical protein
LCIKEPGRENREGGGSDGIGSTSGVSTVNSLKSHKALDFSSSKMHSEYQEQLDGLRMENERWLRKANLISIFTLISLILYRLLTDLLEAQRSYQMLLRSSLEEQKLHLQLLNQTTQQMRLFGQLITLTPPTIIRSSETGFSSHHTINSEDDLSSQAGVADILPEANSAGDNCCHQHHNAAQIPLNVRDPRLIEYLSELHLDRMSIEKVRH